MNKKPLTKKEVIKVLKKIKVIKRNSEIINILNSNKYILAKNIKSLINVPPFNNSAVDGYAIRNEDINIKKFKIVNKILAGDNKKIKLNAGETTQIFTGARMPINARAVVMQENVVVKNEFISILNNPKKNINCRLAGEDVKKNKLLYKKGTFINTSNQSLLASIGLNHLKVYKKLSVGYFTSGNELKNPTTKLYGSEINNTNQFALNSLISQHGFQVSNLGILKDNFNYVRKSIIKYINKFDVIITAGGASVGKEDHLVNVLNEIGKVIFWKIAIKPGRPLAVGLINRKPIICLPGNPVSVFLLFEMIIKSFLFKLAGSKWDEPKFIPAKINFSMKKKTSRLEWLRVKVDYNIKNELIVKKYPKQGSGIISSVAFSDGIIEIPENISNINPGDVFNFYPIFF